MTAASEGYAHRATGSVLWTTAQKWFSRMVRLLTIITLMRLLSPADVGLVAVAMSVVPFVYLLADLGFSTHLVQAEVPKPADFSTASGNPRRPESCSLSCWDWSGCRSSCC
jgi:hypothetical protein